MCLLLLGDTEQKERKAYDDGMPCTLFFMSVLWILDHGKFAQNVFIPCLSALCFSS